MATLTSRSEPRRPSLRVVALLALLWLALAYLVAPWFMGALYRGELPALSAELAQQVAEARERSPLESYLAAWYWLALWPIVALASWWILAHLTTRPRVVGRQVEGATATSLAGFRILVCGVAFVMVLIEDLPSSALLPRGLIEWRGLVGPLRFVPGFTALLASPVALLAVELATLGALLAAALGWRARATLPLSAVGYLLVSGILRLYSRFFHTGLMPLLLLVTLCFTPCADALSVDRRRSPVRASDPEAPLPRYGWARWLCWLVLALGYFEAGLSKLRSGGLLWWHPDNLRDTVLTDSLNPMRFDFDGGLRLVAAPDLVFALMGLAALAVELTYPLVLVSRAARRVLPLAAIGMHVAILLLQNVAFFDQLALQLLFFDFRWLLRPLEKRRSRVEAGMGPPDTGAAIVGARRVRRLAGLLLLAWALKVEFFPLSAMQMYATRDRSATVEYLMVDARLASGATRPAPLEEAIPALADSRYRWLLRRGFESEPRRALAVAYLEAAACAYNRQVEAPERIVAFRVERRRWEFRRDPAAARGERPGELVAAMEIGL